MTRILSISDIELGLIYSPQISKRFAGVDLVISCGDLPYYYLEYIISTLNVPLYFVRGNHACKIEYGIEGNRTAPWGGVDLHQQCKIDSSGLILCGIEGSVRYNNGPYQYTQSQMWTQVARLMPKLLVNKLVYGRYVDIFVTHAPPWKINDQEDLPHQGIKAFRWFINAFKPAFHLHGHIHLYRQALAEETLYQSCRVINTFGFRELDVNVQELASRLSVRRLGDWKGG